LENLLTALLLPTFLLSAAYAQTNNGKTAVNISCRDIVQGRTYWKSLINNEQIKYVKDDKPISLLQMESFTLSDSSDINRFFQKITSKQNYYYKVIPESKKAALKQLRQISDQQSYSNEQQDIIEEKLSSTLTIGSKVFAVDILTEDSTVIKDYVVCGPPPYHQFDDKPFDLLYFKSGSWSGTFNHSKFVLSPPYENQQNTQVNAPQFESCQAVVSHLYQRMQSSDALAYVNGDSLIAVSSLKNYTLSDSSDIDSAFQQISDKHNYYKFDPKLQKLSLKQGVTFYDPTNKDIQEGFDLLKKILSEALVTGNKVFVTELTTESDQTVTDYTVCGPPNKPQLLYNSAYFSLAVMKFETTSYKTTESY